MTQQEILNDQVDCIIHNVTRKYLKENSSDWSLVFDKMSWHYKQDPQTTFDKFLKAFRDLKEKGFLNGSGEATLQKLETLATKDHIDEADVLGDSGNIILTVDDLTQAGVKYCKDTYKYGIMDENI